ncbi:MAG TPA: FtsX-like permease family protein [Polyangiaceae bacterium]|jgi:putative ABC transport system permease protein
MTLARLVLRSAGRHPLRAALTVLAAAAATVAFVLLRCAAGAWTTGARAAVRDRIVTRQRTSFAIPLPVRDRAAVAALPNVRAATHWTWFGGRLVSDGAHATPFAVVAVDAPTYLDVFDEARLPADQRDAWLADRSGAVVGDVLARRFGWRPGDRVTLESAIFPTTDGLPWTFTVRGIYTTDASSMDRSTMLVRWDLLDARSPAWARGRIGAVVSRADDPDDAAGVASAIDRAFEDGEAPTVSQDEATFRSSVLGGAAALLRALDLLAGATLALMTLVLANTLAMGARERTREYAVLRAMGFSPGRVAALVIGEGVVLGAAGGALGVAGARVLLAAGLARWLEERTLTFFPYLDMAPALAIGALLAGAALGAAAAGFPAWRASRLGVIDSLRRA